MRIPASLLPVLALFTTLTLPVAAAGGNGPDSLQARRQLATRLLEEMPRLAGNGLAFKALVRKGEQVTLVGSAVSNARIAAFLRNLDESRLLARPELKEAKAIRLGDRQLNEFTVKAMPPADKPPEAGNACSAPPPMLSRPAEIEDLLVAINETGLKHGLRFELFKPAAEKMGRGYAAIAVDIKVQGNYASLYRFVRDLGQLPGLLTLGDFSLRAGEGRALVFDSVIDIHRSLAPLGAVRPAASARDPRCLAEHGSDIGDPFATAHLNPPATAELRPDPSRRKSPLEELPLDSLQMIGTFNQMGMPTAFVLGGGKVHQIKVGDYLGPNSGMVIRITEDKVVLREVVIEGADRQVERISTLSLQETK